MSTRREQALARREAGNRFIEVIKAGMPAFATFNALPDADITFLQSLAIDSNVVTRIVSIETTHTEEWKVSVNADPLYNGRKYKACALRIACPNGQTVQFWKNYYEDTNPVLDTVGTSLTVKLHKMFPGQKVFHAGKVEANDKYLQLAPGRAFAYAADRVQATITDQASLNAIAYASVQGEVVANADRA